MKELKCFTSYNNYFPQSYLEGSLANDAKAIGVNGEMLKAIKKEIESDLLNLSEEMTNVDIRHSQRRELITKVYKALGYYSLDKAPDFTNERELQIKGKKYSIPVEGMFRFKGGDQLWLMTHQPETAFALIEDFQDLDADKKSEHFFEQPAMATLKDKPAPLPFKDIIEAVFDGDQTNCEFMIINSGDRLYLLERGKWQEGPQSYLDLNLLELFTEINAKDYYVMAEALFSPKGFPIDTAENFHETLERNAFKKATEVTKALRDTVRESIELIADEVLRQHEDNNLSPWKGRDFKNPQDRQACAEELFDQTLKYIYRMLFMLFTESQDQAKGALPVQCKAYQLGYAIEKLRDLETKPYLGSQSEQSQSCFIFETLNKAFKIYFSGYYNDAATDKTDALGFSFPSLGTKLFAPESTPLFLEVRLPDSLMQTVIKKLSLAKTGKGKQAKTHRVHYAGLGLNQLGAVYEGLLTLKPEILGEKVVLLEKEDKEVAHRYIAFSQKDKLKEKQLAHDGDKLLTKEKGRFILTPVGLERKFSASFYTPEVLTRFLAKEAVDTLLGEKPTLEKMESLKILEPAMGSGAFLNAVVDEIAPRMARHYEAPDKKAFENALSKLEASDESKNPKKREELNKLKPKPMSHYVSQAKNHLMRNCVYGIDLNPTAVELAKISLWLNCLHEDGNLPFLDMKLRLGNSLVGAWVKRHQNQKTGHPHWFFPNSQSLKPHLEGKILGEKNRPYIDEQPRIKHLKDLGQSWDEMVKEPRIEERLKSLNDRVQRLFKDHNDLKIAYLEKIRTMSNPLKKEGIFIEYTKKNSAYNQLRTMMDLWCSLWFWPHAELDCLPSSSEFLDALTWLAETPIGYGPDQAKQLAQSGLKFLGIAREISLSTKFFHYDLEFSEVFEKQGGFDLVLGNPPWVPVRWEESDFFEIYSPGLKELLGDSKTKHQQYDAVLRKESSILTDYIKNKARSEGYNSFLKLSDTYPFPDSSQVNTYRYFYQRFFQATRPEGVHAMIAQDGILTDDGCLEMRPTFLNETEKFYRFINEALLFEDVAPYAKYCAWINLRGDTACNFSLIDNLYHPSTVRHSEIESPNAPYVGMKGQDGRYELKGHPKRIVSIDRKVLSTLGEFERQSDPLKASLPIIHGQIELSILSKLAAHPTKMNSTAYEYWRKFDETGAPKAGLIVRKSGKPKSLEYSVLTGPIIFVGNPANKVPKPIVKSHHDYDQLNLDEISNDYYPNTLYQATEKGLKSDEYNSLTPWGVVHSKQYRLAVRGMVNTLSNRTLSAAIIPPGPSHVHSMNSLSFQSVEDLVQMQGLFNSLIFDFLMRSISGGTIGQGIYQMTPVLTQEQKSSMLFRALEARTLRLACISSHYRDLWHSTYHDDFNKCEIESPFMPTVKYKDLKKTWTRDTCIRNVNQREQALCEIDAIVALMFDFDKSTLLNLYRSQFGVLQNNFQDLPGIRIDETKYHFPRYDAMSKAYDKFAKLTKLSSNSNSTNRTDRFMGAS